MKTTVKKLSDTRIEINVSLDANDLAPARDFAIQQLSKELKVEGFRKGKVPAEIAVKFIPENDINTHTADHAVRSTVVKAFVDNEKSPLAIPQVNITKYVPGELLEYSATADILPEVKLGDYKNLGVKKKTVTVNESDVKSILENIAGSFAEKKTVKRAAKLTDEVIIDFVGKKDGVAFAGGSAKDHHLVLGSKTFIPGFEEGVVGHEPGDKFNLDLTFPKDYGSKDLAGAKTTFEILLKQVNEVTPAKIDDEMAKQCGPFKTLAELKADIKKNIEAQNAHRIEEEYKDALIEAFVKKSKISAPEILIDDQLHMIKDDITRNAASRGLSFEDYLKQAGETPESWEKEVRKIAETRVKASLALQVLARDHKITVDEKLVDAKIAELREVYKKSPEALKNLKSPNVRMDIQNRMIVEKTIDFLVKAQK